MSDSIKWEKQCSTAVLKANKILGMIKRNFVDRSSDTIISLYKSLGVDSRFGCNIPNVALLLRPHLEYFSQIWWSPVTPVHT